MTSATARTILRGSIEFLDVAVSANVELDTQDVFISVVPYPYDWITAEWQGDVGTSRTASILGSDANLPADSREVYVKVTDDPEVPIVNAGILSRA